MLAPAPFTEELATYSCQCVQCEQGLKYRWLLPRLFVLGFLIPLCWLCNLALFLYTQVYTDHDVGFPRLAADQLPTQYELGRALQRGHVSFDRDDSGNPRHAHQADVPDTLDVHRFRFLDSVASDVIAAHDGLHAHYLMWTYRTSAAATCYVLALLTVSVLVAEHSTFYIGPPASM